LSLTADFTSNIVYVFPQREVQSEGYDS